MLTMMVMHIYLSKAKFGSISAFAVFVLLGLQHAVFAQTSPASDSKAEPKLAVVLNSGEATVSLIDMPSRKVVKTVPVGKEPHHLMMTPDQRTLLIANAAGNDVVLMNPTTGELTCKIPDIIDPYQIGYSPNHKWLGNPTVLRLRPIRTSNRILFHELLPVYNFLCPLC